MAGMTDKDIKEVSKLIKEIMTQALSQKRAIETILKLTSQDKDISVLAKKMDASHAPFHKDGRALLDKMNKM
jgi:hypothetical protein